METSLHRQLKEHFAATAEQTEVQLDGFRIDAIAPSGELIEIQHAGLGALRDKTRRLLTRSRHSLRIVKPIVARKLRVVTLAKRDGEVIRSRMSPKRGELIDLFQDLVHFADVFPMKRLTLEFVLIEAEEVRIDRAQVRAGEKVHFARPTSGVGGPIDRTAHREICCDCCHLSTFPPLSTPHIWRQTCSDRVGLPRKLAIACGNQGLPNWWASGKTASCFSRPRHRGRAA